MNRVKYRLIAVAVALLMPNVAYGAVETYTNDSFGGEGTVAFQSGTIAGEIPTACFTPPSDDYPVRLLAVQFLFAGGSTGVERLINLKVFASGGGGSPPGDLVLDLQDVQVESSESALNEIDVSTAGLSTFRESFCVGIELTHDGVPTLATDIDRIAVPVNNWLWVLDGTSREPIGWLQTSDLGVSGDWIIRARVDTSDSSTPSEDTGRPMPDAGVEDVPSGNDAGSDVFIASVSPNSAMADEEIEVVIIGGGFTDEMDFRLGPASLDDVEIPGDTTAIGTLGAGDLEPGTYDIIVSRRGAQLAVFTQGFQVRAVNDENDEEETIIAESACGCSSADPIGGAGGWLTLALFAFVMTRKRNSSRFER
jgi:MYXO-CTERM domain-containing protein